MPSQGQRGAWDYLAAVERAAVARQGLPAHAPLSTARGPDSCRVRAVPLVVPGSTRRCPAREVTIVLATAIPVPCRATPLLAATRERRAATPRPPRRRLPPGVPGTARAPPARAPGRDRCCEPVPAAGSGLLPEPTASGSSGGA